tara:strand:- start:179 stop:418 length:240 start_codon:yes stop_codon:yes gene_type:complete
MISYGGVYKRSSKPVMRGSRIELLKMRVRNITSYWMRVGRRQVFLEVIFNFKKHLHNFLKLVILVHLKKFKCKIKELKR